MEAKTATGQDYWVVRSAIIKASQEKDEEAMKALAKMYPKIFDNVVRFAKHQMRNQRKTANES